MCVYCNKKCLLGLNVQAPVPIVIKKSILKSEMLGFKVLWVKQFKMKHKNI